MSGIYIGICLGVCNVCFSMQISHFLSLTHPDEDDVCGLDGDVGAGPDGDPDVRLRQRRRVVDAVAYHRYLQMSLTTWSRLGVLGHEVA